MNLPFFIARRYLFAKKSHSVINIISAIGAIGMCIGTAAFIVILSVYNGFDRIVVETMGNVEPDILVSPEEGKVFLPEGEGFDYLYDCEDIESVSLVLQDNVYIKYGESGGIARAKGVDEEYEKSTPLRDRLQEGEFSLYKGSVPLAVVGYGIAYKMGISPRFLGGIEVYYPDRESEISMSNPASSLSMAKVYPSGIFAVNNDIDNELIILPIDELRDLFGYEEEVSAVEVRMKEGVSTRQTRRLVSTLRDMLGPSFKVSDRYHQNETLYKMMRYEKAAVYLILAFVIIIIAFNIFSSLSMLLMEKQEDISTLRSLGAEDSLIKKIFVLEGWLISLVGLVSGLVVGIMIVLIQGWTGIVKMPSGTFLTNAYPVVLSPWDVLISIVVIALIGYIVALIPVRRGIADEKR